MSVTVDPAQLDGYADQIERNSGFLIQPLRDFCGRHCGQTEATTGLLAALTPLLEQTFESSMLLFTSAERHLLQVAVNLRVAAGEYRSSDVAAAEKIWLVLPRRLAPDGYVDVDDDRHSGDFRDPFMPRVVPPADRHELQHAVEEAKHTIRVIDDYLGRYLRFRLSDQVFPLIAGDWGVIRQRADGYAGLAGMGGVETIRANLAYGMDSVSASWDSPAATQFAFQIRERWVIAIETFEHLLTLYQQELDMVAQNAESTFHILVLIVDALRYWVIEKLLRLAKSFGGLLLGRGLLNELADLALQVISVWHLIRHLLEALRWTFLAAAEGARYYGTLVTLIEDLWKAPGSGRLEPITAG